MNIFIFVFYVYVLVSDTGKKTFMYFSSDVGKGFIISDDEEVTGVISVMNMSRKKSRKIRFKWNCIRINLKSLGPSILLTFFKFFILFRDKITGTITDTLKRNTKRKKSKANHDIPNFLFVNKPYFSSEESLPGTDELRVIFTFWPFLRDKISDWRNNILEFYNDLKT